VTGNEKKGAEQRQVSRRHLLFYLRVFDGMSSRVVGHLIDISAKGLMLLCDEPVALNEEYRLRMRLPLDIVGTDEIVFKSTSRWCRPDDNPDFYISGFQIQGLDSESERAISSLIEEFGFSYQEEEC